MVRVREARGDDVADIRKIFVATYGEDYPYDRYYDLESLRRMVYADDTILLVAEDEAGGGILGTASVVMEVGAYADFVGEFGRLAVDPEARRRGVGTALMEGRLERARERLHLALVEPRAVHPFSQKISDRFGFVPVGFLPMKHQFRKRESLALFVQYFGDTLSQRKNHPRVIPEVYPLADLALRNCELGPDAIVNSAAAPYPPAVGFELETFTDQAYTALLHIERGRVERREIVGPMRLHYGLFKLRVSRARYLVARRGGRLAGAVGVTVDDNERIAKVFELISPDDEAVRFLLEQVVERCDGEWGMAYVEADVNAHAPRMQRTLLELGFRPVGYIPAMVFDRVERLDTVRMVRLGLPLETGDLHLIDSVKAVAEAAVSGFRGSYGRPEVAEAAAAARLFSGMSSEQIERMAEAMTVRDFGRGEAILRQGDEDGTGYLVLDGSAEVFVDEVGVGNVGVGECLGELALLTGQPHRATVRAACDLRAAVLERGPLMRLLRARPDVGVLLYRNLALDLREKLDRADRGAGPE